MSFQMAAFSLKTFRLFFLEPYYNFFNIIDLAAPFWSWYLHKEVKTYFIASSPQILNPSFMQINICTAIMAISGKTLILKKE